MVLWAPLSNKAMALMGLAYVDVRMVTGAQGIGCEGEMVLVLISKDFLYFSFFITW